MNNYSNINSFLRISSIFLIFFVFLDCASKVEFLADPNFTEENKFYTKKDPSEVELVRERPRRDFQYVGTVIFRNFNSSQIELNKLQEEMFKMKIDGVLIKKTSVEEVAPFLITSKNNEGMMLGYQETNKEMGKLIGYPFRYIRR